MDLRGQRPGADATAANAKSFSSRVTDFRVNMIGRLGMNSDKNPDSRATENREPDTEERMAVADDYVPLSVRDARQMRKTLWPHLWMSLASIILLAVALAILSYRMGAQSCH